MKVGFAFILLAGFFVVALATENEEDVEIPESQWVIFARSIYETICTPEPGPNKCVELTKETYKTVLKPYRPQIKAKCKEYKAAGQFWLHWPCIALIKTIPKQ